MKTIICPHCKKKIRYTSIVCPHCNKPIGRKFDDNKIQWSLLPWAAIEKIVLIMMFGAKKYAPNNWQLVQPPIRYIDACIRHITAWLNGEQNDKETGYSHLWHAGCNIIFAIYLELKGKLICPTK